MQKKGLYFSFNSIPTASVEQLMGNLGFWGKTKR